jgi:hypothetical protein
MDFIFHIGMHKCGSTHLQRNVFTNYSGFLGVKHSKDNLGDLAWDFVEIAPVGGRQNFNQSNLLRWLDEIKAKHSDLDRVIISSEYLCQSNKITSRPIIKLFSNLKRLINPDDELKVILVVRNQVDLIASEYAQLSPQTRNPSQDNFVKFSRKRVSKYHKTFNWMEWHDELSQSLGLNNVLFLLLEEMEKKCFYDQLENFLGVNAGLNYNNFASSENRRRINKSEWSIQEYSPYQHSISITNAVFNLFWRKSKFIKLRNSFLKFAICSSTNILSIRINDKRNKKIYLTNQISSIIKDKFEESNKEFGKLIGRNLKIYGY